MCSTMNQNPLRIEDHPALKHHVVVGIGLLFTLIWRLSMRFFGI